MAAAPYIVVKGVVLRETETKESDKILTLLTTEQGKVSVIARGARRKGCKFAAAAQPLAFSEWTLYRKGDWHYANEGATIEMFGGLRRDLTRLALGTYFAELTESVTNPGEPAAALLSHLLNGLYALDKLKKQGVLNCMPLYSYVAAVSVGIVNDEPACDLDYVEDSGGQVDFNFIMDDEGNIIELQGTGEERPFSKKELDDMYLLAQNGIRQLVAAQKQAVGHLFR